ncbi:MAG: 1-aminocyclopropane-1-carboxylate deaminase/D-cysteine desulfhydrase [Bacteroidota bacterium]
MDTIDERSVTIQPLHKDWYGSKIAAVDMLRLDLVHSVVSGNKWYKLRLNIHEAVERGYKAILTFGGGYSNHLVATAFAAKLHGLKSIGIVRGRHDELTPTLQQCIGYGMELIFVTHDDYKNKDQPDWARTLVSHFDELLIIPEGGANGWGRKGAGLITRFISPGYTHVVLSVGTGTTFAGIRNNLPTYQQMLGFVPMKQGTYLSEHINPYLSTDANRNWQLTDDWHFGGFGKWNESLLLFMNGFYQMNNIPLDIIYTSKMMYGLQQMIANDSFNAADRILCIHSGGLQGNSSVAKWLNY